MGLTLVNKVGTRADFLGEVTLSEGYTNLSDIAPSGWNSVQFFIFLSTTDTNGRWSTIRACDETGSTNAAVLLQADIHVPSTGTRKRNVYSPIFFKSSLPPRLNYSVTAGNVISSAKAIFYK